MSLIERTRAGFLEAYGTEPEGVAFAPGRVNLIGEHVDYNDGLVLPMPISTGTAVAWGRASGREIEAVALDFGTERDRFVTGEAAPYNPVDWRSYLRGMADGMARRGVTARGLNLALAGSNPRGSGLSSSASLCIALGRAIAAAAGTKLSPRELALAAQAAEHDWAGVNCGIMDQMAIAAGEPGHALLLDCRDLSSRQVTLPRGWTVAIIQSGVTRGLVDGHYNARRRDCEAAVAALGVSSLREASLDMIAVADLDPAISARASHVVSEIARTQAAVAAIEALDIRALGALLRASHVSLRDQFEVSVPKVDALVDLANAAIGPNGGARMTGGGFGGAVVAVLQRDAVADFVTTLERQFAEPTGMPLNLMIEGTGGLSADAML
jgi:galactokinase